jgi:Holliday junction resolvase RusA-like endonuclease
VADPIRIVIDGFAQAQRSPQGVIMPPLPKPMRGKYYVQMHTPAEVRKWQFDAKRIGIEQMQGRIPLTGALEVNITIYLPLPKSMPRKKVALALSGDLLPTTRPDCSNYCKAIEDSLNGVAWLDDSQIAVLHVRKKFSEKPRVEITVEQIEMKTAPVKDAAATASLFPSG